MTVTRIYSPTNGANNKDKETLNKLLQKEIDATPLHDLLILHGDANVKVGSGNTSWEGSMSNKWL